MGIKQPVLVIFNRGYSSIEFIDSLEKEGLHYLIYLSSNDHKAERKQMQSEDEEVILKHSSARLQKIRQKHPGRYKNTKKKGKTAVRILSSTLPSRNELTLITTFQLQLPQKI